MTLLCFSLTLLLRTQKNGTLVATCPTLPMLAGGHDADSLVDQLVKILRSVVNRLEALPMDEAQEYLSSHGIECTRTTGTVEAVGFDEKRLRMMIKNWAADEEETLTVQFPVAA